MFESPKDTLWCYMKDTDLCTKFTILERCLHYLMIAPRIINSGRLPLFQCCYFNINSLTKNRCGSSSGEERGGGGGGGAGGGDRTALSP